MSARIPVTPSCWEHTFDGHLPYSPVGIWESPGSRAGN